MLSNNPLASSGHWPYWNSWQWLSVSLPLNTLSIRLTIRMLLSPFFTWPFFFSCSSSLWAITVGLHQGTNFVPLLHSIYTTPYVTSSHLMTLNNTFVLMNPKCIPKLKQPAAYHAYLLGGPIRISYSICLNTNPTSTLQTHLLLLAPFLLRYIGFPDFPASPFYSSSPHLLGSKYTGGTLPI